jgi:antitoxin (DNA-binding transcriptional repressor) of toxin-antitoxin stability system
MIVLDVHELDRSFADLLVAVESRGEWVRITREGRPVADLRPIARAVDHLHQHPELMGVQFNQDPMLPLDEDEWPEPC